MIFKKTGIALIEVLIYTAILVFILSLTTNFLYQAANFKLLYQSKSALFQNSSFAIEKINKDIKASQAVIMPDSENFASSLILQTEQGQISYQAVDGVLKRNGVDLTDNSVIINLQPPNNGFRKIGQTIQAKIGFKAKIKPFGQSKKEEVYQTTFYLSQ